MDASLVIVCPKVVNTVPLKVMLAEPANAPPLLYWTWVFDQPGLLPAPEYPEKPLKPLIPDPENPEYPLIPDPLYPENPEYPLIPDPLYPLKPEVP